MTTKRKLSDPVFIAKLKERDQGAITLVVKSYTSHLVRAARGLGFNETDADELTSQSFITLFEVLPKFRGDSHIRTFLFGIFYRKVKEFYRTQKKHSSHEVLEETSESLFDDTGHWQTQSGPENPENFALVQENIGLAQQCMDKLGENQKIAFFLKVVEGRDYEEICHILGLNNTNLRQILHRGKTSLRKCIEGLQV